MAITFDGATKRIILDSASVEAAEIWSRWSDWHASNPEWPLAFRQVGGDDLGGGLLIPPYFFLLNGWRVRPMEANHTLVLTGNLFVEGGGQPVVQTLGAYNVSVQYTVPVQAQAFATGGGTAPTPAQIWAHLIDGLAAEDLMKVFAAVLAGKSSGFGAGAPIFRNLGDSVDRVAATLDADGNRGSVTLDLG